MRTGQAVGIGVDEVEEIVDEAVDDYLPLTGGTLSGILVANNGVIVGTSGNLLVQRQTILDDTLLVRKGTGSPTITIDATGGNDALINFRGSGVDRGYVRATANYLMLDKRTRQADGSYESNQLLIYEGYSQFSGPVRGVAPVGATDLTTRQYVNDTINSAVSAVQTAVDNIEALLAVDDTAMDTLQEIIDRIKAVDPDLDGLQQSDVAGLVAALAGKASIDYVDAQRDTRVAKSGDTMTGELRLRPATGNGVLRFYDSNTLSNELYGLAQRFIMRHHKSAGGFVDFAVYDDYCTTTVPIRAADPVFSTDLTTKQWVDAQLTGKAATTHNHAASQITSGTLANARISESSVTQHEAALTLTESQISDLADYLPLAGGALTGGLEVIANNKISAAGTTAAAFLEYTNDSTRSALIYRTGPGDGATDVGSLRIRRYNTKDNSVTSELTLGNGSINCNVPVLVPNSSNTGSATTKGYVDDTFLPLTGGTLTGGLNVDVDGPAYLYLDSAGTNLAIMRLRQDGADKGYLFADAGSVRLAFTGTSGAFTTLDLNENTAIFSKNLLVNGTTNLGALNISGGVVMARESPQFVLNAEKNDSGIDTVPQIYFKQDGVNRGDIWGLDNRMLFRRYTYDDAGVSTGNNRFEMYDGYSIFDHDVRGPLFPTFASSLTSRDYVDNTFLPLTGGTINGNVDIARSSGDTNINIDAVVNGVFRFKNEGTTNTTLVSNDSEFKIEFDADTNANNRLVMYAGYTEFNKQVRGVDGTSDASLTTKGYVDDNKLDKTGGTLSGNLSVDGIGTVNDPNTGARLHIQSGTANPGTLRFYKNTTNISSWINAGDASITLRQFNSVGGNTEFSITNDNIVANKEIRGVDGTDLASLTTKSYVDGFLPLTGGIIEAEGNNNSVLDFRRNGEYKGGIIAFDNRFSLRNGSANLDLYPTQIIATTEVRSLTATTSNSLDSALTTKGYVDDQRNVYGDGETSQYTGSASHDTTTKTVVQTLNYTAAAAGKYLIEATGSMVTDVTGIKCYLSFVVGSNEFTEVVSNLDAGDRSPFYIRYFSTVAADASLSYSLALRSQANGSTVRIRQSEITIKQVA